MTFPCRNGVPARVAKTKSSSPENRERRRCSRQGAGEIGKHDDLTLAGDDLDTRLDDINRRLDRLIERSKRIDRKLEELVELAEKKAASQSAEIDRLTDG